MKYFLLFGGALVICVLTFAGVLYWKYAKLIPEPSSEVVQFTPEKRAVLERLKKENKFQPHHFPPLGYTGAETPEDLARATEAVNGVIDAVLAQPNGPVHARTVSNPIGKAMSLVSRLATEDRDRTSGYLLEVWYILGLKGATGQFASGAAYSKAPGHSEPLPPGWTTADQPRPINP
ncbi:MULTISPECIES: hypothetical protein [unclassified Bradyrhizobium]|uniref:hypothetical protein n=1 Tax=unclassified Bradyrhizobium TaxID=2631580 RepID=UPI001FF62A83|nr:MULTISPECIES: hypothetical protein [unclassified Bradyrhizobium]MCJ9704097.1 hypothetical protein [Bradyrhizobium sp. SHOUNA76]MCJ9733940.1 hypothetical protein [Bradyrhizobium sp. PRIMUS42]